MKIFKSIFVIGTIITGVFVSSCKKETNKFTTNGETIFKTGKNIQGEVLQDLSKSEMNGSIHGCADCHGDDGKGKYRGGGSKQTGSITYNDLTNPSKYSPVYSDSLIKRFIDSETKSDGTHANTGVVFVMQENDKVDLINFLKQL